MRTSTIATSSLLLVVSSACSSTSTPASTGNSGSEGTDGGAPVTFTRVYSDIISPVCMTCHNPSGDGFTAGKLDMSSQATGFTNLVGVAAAGAECGGKGTRVVAGNADMSILYQKVTTPTCGSPMPLGGTPLTDAQTEEIQSWINAGAMND